MVANVGPNTVWTNDGNGTFTDSEQALGTMFSFSLALGDLDEDGDVDAMVGNFGTNTVWTNDGIGSFTPCEQALGNGSSTSVALGDLDGDGDVDAVVTNFAGGETTFQTNQINGACCVGGACFQTQLDTCQSIGGTYLGGNCSIAICEEPEATGACCVATGCEELTKNACENLGGTWLVPGSCSDCPAPCPPDVNGDGVVDGTDLALILGAWGVCP